MFDFSESVACNMFPTQQKSYNTLTGQSEPTATNENSLFTFSKASSVFSGLAFRAWDASMMGIGMKRMVKFLKDTKPQDVRHFFFHECGTK